MLTYSRQRIFLHAVALLVGCGEYDYDLGLTTGAGAGATGGGGVSGAAGDSSSVGGVLVSGAGGEGGDRPLVPDPTALIGWASVAECGPRGTTGGELGDTIRPVGVAALDDAVRAAGPAIIEIAGRLELGDTVLQVSGDKTLVGVNGGELVGGVRVRDARNVILRNLKLNGGGVPGSIDALEIDNSACVWIDHCEIFDGGDSNLDIVRGSDLVTVSWSKLYYATKTDDHRLGSVCGNTDSDSPDRINVTFHHNHWGSGLLLNMPSVRHGKVHIFNNYFGASGNDYCISAGYMSRLLVQNNVFDGVANPLVFGADQDTAEVVETGNDYTTATGTRVSRGPSFEPPYPYNLDDASVVAEGVTTGAGPR